MKLWIGGEIEGPIDEVFRDARRTVEQSINAAIENNSYDLPLDAWDCIIILRKDESFEEFTRYSKKKRDMDFRLKINFNAFEAGPQKQREKLIFQMLERSLSILREKGLPNEGLEKLHGDVLSVANARCWI